MTAGSKEPVLDNAEQGTSLSCSAPWGKFLRNEVSMIYPQLVCLSYTKFSDLIHKLEVLIQIYYARNFGKHTTESFHLS